MTQLDTDSLEKQGKIETVYHRASVTLGVNFSKALAAASAQMPGYTQGPEPKPWL